MHLDNHQAEAEQVNPEEAEAWTHMDAPTGRQGAAAVGLLGNLQGAGILVGDVLLRCMTSTPVTSHQDRQAPTRRRQVKATLTPSSIRGQGPRWTRSAAAPLERPTGI